MSEWTIEVEAFGGYGHAPVAEVVLDRFVEALEAYEGTAALTETGWSATLTVEHEWPSEAARIGHETAAKAAADAGMPDWLVVKSLNTTEANLFAARMAEPPFPDVVGVQEVLDMLGISRQRLHELRNADRFPEPVLVLAATPVWLRSTITAFEGQWNRRPGRRWPAAS